MVERRYIPSPDACTEAVGILLRPDRKKGGPSTSRLDDAMMKQMQGVSHVEQRPN
jgi:hypothetical protein